MRCWEKLGGSLGPQVLQKAGQGKCFFIVEYMVIGSDLTNLSPLSVFVSLFLYSKYFPKFPLPSRPLLSLIMTLLVMADLGPTAETLLLLPF